MGGRGGVEAGLSEVVVGLEVEPEGGLRPAGGFEADGEGGRDGSAGVKDVEEEVEVDAEEGGGLGG